MVKGKLTLRTELEGGSQVYSTAVPRKHNRDGH